jgi:predicted amidohydrolase YtcJ
MRKSVLIFIVLVLVPAAASAQKSSAAVPDQIFYNGKIITVDSAFHMAQAFAIKSDTFFAVGGNAAMKALAGPKTRVTDLQGRVVIPGLMDNHLHMYSASVLDFRGVDLSGITSLTEMRDRLRRAVAAAKPGDTVFTNSRWNENALREKRGPTRQELDEVSAGHPVVVFRARRTLYVNSAALKLVGISRDTQALEGNTIAKDSTGEPTGLLSGPTTVDAVVSKIIPPPTLAEEKEVIKQAQLQQHALGLTSIREVELRADVMRAYWSLWREGKLTMRVHMGLNIAATEADMTEEILKPWGVGTGFGDHRLRLDSVGEFAVDGIPNNAYLREPHSDLPGNNLGAFRLTPEQLRQSMFTIDRYGWRPAIHIAGDRALDNVLDAYEAVNAVSPIRDKRWIVEHIPLVHPEQMERLAKMGVLVSAQFGPYNGAEGMIASWGKERADRAVPVRELLDHHLLVSAGSDLPGSGTSNPMVAFYFYVTRKTARGTIAGASQKISREEALRLATVNNAYMTFEEDAKGSVEPGKLADFLILSADILTIPDDEILSLHPLATYVGGEKVYSSPGGGF